MDTSSSTTATPAPRRVKKRLVIPVILLALVVLLLVVLSIRGTWADDVEKAPASADEGTLTQLYRGPDGGIYVRCALVVEAPPREVWAVVTDYNHQAEFLPYVSQMSGEPEADGRYHIRGVAHSRLWGDWPFESQVTLEEHPDRGEYRAFWGEEGTGELAINRGSWVLRPAGEGRTLLSYALQIEVARYPAFLVRNIIMDRLHLVVSAVRDEVQRRRAARQ
jgi:carbon monoxide dehydrogenase subunit G